MTRLAVFSAPGVLAETRGVGVARGRESRNSTEPRAQEADTFPSGHLQYPNPLIFHPPLNGLHATPAGNGLKGIQKVA